MTESLESKNRFTLVGKSTIQYAVLVTAIAAVLITIYSLIVCAKTKLSRRKWLWVLFILVGFGKIAVNWATGEWGVAPFSVQLFSASAFAPLYGPWTIAASIPVGAIAFLIYKRSRLELKAES
jgi:drug/metabolite transporter (DMT)-like permease